MIISTDDYNNHGDYDDNYDDNDDDNELELDDEDWICNNSANFQARHSIFSMVIDVYKT